MIGVLGAGAFGTALAVVLAREGRDVTLWARDAAQLAAMQATRLNDRLPGVALPANLAVTADLAEAARQPTLLLCLPTQALGAFLDAEGAGWSGRLVACCKGVDLTTLRGPTALITRACPAATPAIITGPSFAADIARGLPTALTLACTAAAAAAELQRELSTATLRLYRSADVTGAELGGALKNVIAIAAGVVIGAGLGESARAALMTRGYAEMVRLATALGARAETLAGLSGFGDLVLTCSSDQSRNFRFGLSLGRGEAFDPKVTVEGAATARAVTRLSGGMGVDMPITAAVASLIAGDITVPQAMHSLLSRPLKQE